MRKYIYMLAAGIIACVPAHAQKYTVTGTAEGTEDGDTVYLCKAQGYGLVNTDTAVIRNGQFTFTGDVPAEGYAMRYIRPTHAGETKGLCMAQVVLEEAGIKVRTFKSDPKYKDGEVESTGKNHQLLTEYRAATSGIGKGMDDSYRIVTQRIAIGGRYDDAVDLTDGLFHLAGFLDGDLLAVVEGYYERRAETGCLDFVEIRKDVRI